MQKSHFKCLIGINMNQVITCESWLLNRTVLTHCLLDTQNEPSKNARACLRTLGVSFSPEDRADLEMFLAPESSINVSDL